MYKRLRIPPGVDRESTEYTAEGRWYGANNVRFRGHFAEAIGGWLRDGDTNLEGIVRSVFSFVTYDGNQYGAVGTNWKFYLMSGSSPYDITPIRKSTAPDDCITSTNTSPLLTIADVAHGAIVNDFVLISGAETLGSSNITAAVLNQEYQIVEIVNSDSYKVIAKDPTTGDTVTSNASESNAGGAGIALRYEVNVGLASETTGTGWGLVAWGDGAWGEPANVSIITGALRLTTIDNFGQNLIIGNRGGPLYFWNPDTAITNGVPETDGDERAVVFSDIGGSSNPPTIVNEFYISSKDGHCVALGCNDLGKTTVNSLLVRWSDQDNPFFWTPKTTNTAGGYELRHGSEILGFVETRHETLIWTNSAVYSMRFVGPPDTFGFELVASNVNMLSGRSAIGVAGKVFFMGSDGFYTYTGTVKTLPCTVEKYVFNDINLSAKKKIFAGSNSLFSEVYWFYPSSSSAEPDRYVLFNYSDSSWSIGTLDMSALDIDDTVSGPNNRTCWDDAAIFSKPKAGFISSWAPAGVDTLPVQKSGLMVHETGSSANGSSMDCSIESGDVEISDGDYYSMLSRVYPDVKFFDIDSDSEDPVLTMSVLAKDFPGSTESSISSVAVTHSNSGGTYGVNGGTPSGNATAIRGRGRALSVKFSSAGTTFKWRLGDTRIGMRQDGRR